MRRKDSGWKGALIWNLLLLPVLCQAQVSPEIAGEPAFPDPSIEESLFRLSPNALQVARIVGVEPFIRKLSALAGAREPGASSDRALEELVLRQHITGAVVIGSLDVDTALDRIDDELERVIELQGALLAQRQRSIGITNFATLALSTGLGAIGGFLQFSDSTRTVGDGIGFAAGGISSFLSFHSMRRQHGGKRPAWVLPNMLAPFFAKSEVENDIYPQGVWKYLDSAPPEGTSQATRREQLLAHWRTMNRFPNVDSASYTSQIALLTETNAVNNKLNIDLLSDRAAMLADVRREVSLVKHGLRDLLRVVLLLE